MFIKPYRNLLLNDPIKSHAEWLRKDMELAPQALLKSFSAHVEGIESDTIQYHLAPVFRQVISGKNLLMFLYNSLVILTLSCETWHLVKLLLNLLWLSQKT